MPFDQELYNAIMAGMDGKLEKLAKAEDLTRVEAKLATLAGEIEQHKGDVCTLRKANADLEAKVAELDRRMRGNAIVLKGHKQQQSENLEEEVRRFFHDVLGVSNINSFYGYRVGSPSLPSRPIIIELPFLSRQTGIFRRKKC